MNCVNSNRELIITIWYFNRHVSAFYLYMCRMIQSLACITETDAYLKGSILKNILLKFF